MPVTGPEILGTTPPPATDVVEALPQPTLPDRLGADDRAVLVRLLQEPTPFVEHPALATADTVVLFGAAPRLLPGEVSRFPAPRPVVAPRLASATRVPALATEQEQLLFLRLNYVRKQIRDMRAAFAGQLLSLDSARELAAWGRWELEMRARIVELNLPLVLAMAKRTRLNGVDFNEMISEGNMALLRSVDKFDCNRGFKFSTYACRAILKSFSRVAMRTSRYRGTFPVEFDPAIEKSDHLERKRDDLEADCVSELKTILVRNMAALTEVEQTVIKQRFALDAQIGEPPIPKTLEEVGRVIGVTKERVRQIQNKALKKIRSALEDGFLAA
jgi:RNA polymerase sigma factor (sigma-70 family)